MIAYFVVGLLFAVGPLLILIAFISSIPKVEFVRDSVTASGKVIRLERSYSRRFSKEVYRPVVRFTDGDGKTQIFIAESRSGIVALKPGDLVPVRYLKGSPRTARIDTIAQMWMPHLIVAFIGAIFVFFSVRILLRRRQLGTVAMGR